MEKIKTPLLFMVTVLTVAFLWAFISANSYRSKADLGEVLVYFGTQTVNNNEITLPVILESDVSEKISSATININYDQTKVQFVSVDHTGCSSLDSSLVAEDSPTTGVVSETKVRIDDALPSGVFCFANFKFTTIGDDTGVFTIDTVNSQIVGPGPISYTVKTNDGLETTATKPNASVYFGTNVISSNKKSVLLPVAIKTDTGKKVSSAKVTLWYDKSKVNYASVDLTNCQLLNTAFNVIDSSSSGTVSQTKVRLDNTLPSGAFCFTRLNFSAKTGVSGKAIIYVLKTKSEIVGPGPTSFNVTTGTGSAVQLTIANGLITSVVPTVIPTTAPTKTPTPTTTPGGNVTLNLKLKFQGVLKKPASGQTTQTVKVKMVDKNGTSKSGSGNFTADDKGIWTGSVSMSATVGSNYKIFIKGPKHIQKRICDTKPTETYPGSYHCEKGEITIKAGVNSLDFSGVLLLAGDLPAQDGVVNSYDTSLVRNNLAKTDSAVLSKADLNFDGIVDTQDYSLIISALSIRGDEGD